MQDRLKLEYNPTNLAEVNVFYLAECALQSTAARSIDTETKTVHSFHKQRQATRVGGRLATQECLLRHSTGDLTGNEEVGLAAELFHELVSWSRVEDVVLNRHILVIKLLQDTQGGNIGRPVTESSVTELVCNGLEEN